MKLHLEILFRYILILGHPLLKEPVDLQSQFQGEEGKQEKRRRIQLMVQWVQYVQIPN